MIDCDRNGREEEEEEKQTSWVVTKVDVPDEEDREVVIDVKEVDLAVALSQDHDELQRKKRKQLGEVLSLSLSSRSKWESLRCR